MTSQLLMIDKMSSDKTNLYVLLLKKNKYYIGVSDDIYRRYNEHLDGKAAVWTKVYRPIKILEIKLNVSPFEEDAKTKEYMATYGIENVRGGSYCQFKLDEDQIKTINKEIWGATKKCIGCGSDAHYIKKCYNISQ